MEDASIESVLNKIEESSEFYFLFNHKLIDVNRKVDIRLKTDPDQMRSLRMMSGLLLDRQIVLTQIKQLYLVLILSAADINGNSY